jgi:hypothetical protein
MDSPSPSPTDIPYHLGLAEIAKHGPNQISLTDQIANGIPPEELAAELAYLDPPQMSLGYGNLFGFSVKGLPKEPDTPYQLHPTSVKAENILAINQDANNPDLVEIVYAQASKIGQTRAILHVLIDHDAQQAFAKIAGLDTNTLFDKNSISKLVNGDISALDLLICINVIYDPVRVNEPAFALVKQVVEAEGAHRWDLVTFTSDDAPVDVYELYAKFINSSLFISLSARAQ